MTRETEQKILSIFARHGGYARAETLRGEGIHPIHLASLVESGALVRLKRGLYALSKGATRSELVDIQKAVPGGIFCLGTALSIHGLGTWEPAEVQLAIRRDSRIALPDFPPVRLFSFSGSRFDLGIAEQSTKAGVVKVYNREKTICDVVRFRNSLGLDLALEALREYLKLRGKDIPQLLEYAKILRMEGSMRSYLEALV